jgi:hypothetical protein
MPPKLHLRCRFDNRDHHCHLHVALPRLHTSAVSAGVAHAGLDISPAGGRRPPPHAASTPPGHQSRDRPRGG